VFVHHLLLSGQCGKVIVTLGRRFTNRHRCGKTVNVRKGPPDKNRGRCGKMAVRRGSTTCHTSQYTCTFFPFYFHLASVEKNLHLRSKNLPRLLFSY